MADNDTSDVVKMAIIRVSCAVLLLGSVSATLVRRVKLWRHVRGREMCDIVVSAGKLCIPVFGCLVAAFVCCFHDWVQECDSTANYSGLKHTKFRKGCVIIHQKLAARTMHPVIQNKA